MWKKTKKKIIGNIIQLNYTKKKINYVVMDVFSFIIKVHLNSLFCFLIATDNLYIDFFIQTLISIGFYYNGSICNDIVYIYKKKFLYLTNYYIDNYSKQNIEIWKKKIILGINIYLIGILYSINVTSNILILYSIQYMFYLLILDYINNRKWIYFYKKMFNWYYKPKSIIYINTDIQIKENYIDDYEDINYLKNLYTSKIDNKDNKNKNNKNIMIK